MTCKSTCSSQKTHILLSRRALAVGLASASAAVLPTAFRASFVGQVFPAAAEQVASSAAIAGAVSAEDARFMRMALEEAQKADFPFGAVIVRDGAVIARGGNLGRTTGDPTAHSEMVALRRGIAEKGPDTLRGATVYATGEPCAMCMSAILWCGLGRLVFGASLAQLLTKVDQIGLTSAEIAAKAPFAPIAIVGGVLADEAMALLGN